MHTKNSFGHNNTSKIILFSSCTFILSLFLHLLFNFSVPLYISGFFFAIFVPGMAIDNLLTPKEDWLTKIITAPVFTIFFFIPFHYAITLLANREINLTLSLITVLTIIICSFIITSKKDNKEKTEGNDYGKFIFFGIGVFILLHLATTLAYNFVPEIDGYADIARIQNIISSEVFNVTYRPLFAFFVSYVSIISQISPYWLFKFGMIIIQLSGVYYLYQFAKTSGLKNTFIKYLTLLSFVSVPIINLEMDYVRPNIIFLFAFLPFVYYLSKGLDSEKKYLFFSSIIATIGLLFHEFFGILFLINFFFIARYFYAKLGNSKKIITLISSVFFLVFLLINIKKIPSLLFIFDTIDSLMETVSAGLTWHWWFLGGYSNIDGFDLGWTGLQDVLNYYAYSASPFLIIIFFFYLLILVKKIYSKEKTSYAEKIVLSILAVSLLFAEFLPRINYPTLPDRFWPMISLSLLILSPFVLTKLKFADKKIFRIIAIALVFIGTSGSIYIAKAKGGYVSESEYEAAQWIKNNTPENSLFITQGENGVMLGYFAGRGNIITPNPPFFGIEKPFSTPKKSEKMRKNIDSLREKSLEHPSDQITASLNSNLIAYQKELEKEKLIDYISTGNFILPEVENIYVLYSFDKFNSYYVNREWWREATFYGADLEKFNDANNYELVYNNNDAVYIWKKK